MKIRLIERQRTGTIQAYVVPNTDHWADWMDADAVAYHGEHIASCVDGQWVDTDGYRIDGRQYGRARFAGISTR